MVLIEGVEGFHFLSSWRGWLRLLVRYPVRYAAGAWCFFYVVYQLLLSSVPTIEAILSDPAPNALWNVIFLSVTVGAISKIAAGCFAEFVSDLLFGLLDRLGW